MNYEIILAELSDKSIVSFENKIVNIFPTGNQENHVLSDLFKAIKACGFEESMCFHSAYLRCKYNIRSNID